MTQLQTHAARAAQLFHQENPSPLNVAEATRYLDDNCMAQLLLQRNDRSGVTAACVLMQDDSLLKINLNQDNPYLSPLTAPDTIAHARTIAQSPDYDTADRDAPISDNPSHAETAAHLHRSLDDRSSRKAKKFFKKHEHRHTLGTVTLGTASVHPWRDRESVFTVMKDRTAWVIHTVSVPAKYTNGNTSPMTINGEGNPVPMQIATFESPAIHGLGPEIENALWEMLHAAMP